MNKNNIIKFLKNRLGISTDKKDDDLTSVVDGILEELESNKIDVTKAVNEISEFVIDYAFFRYSNRDTIDLPKNLNRRLNNLIVNYGKENVESSL